MLLDEATSALDTVTEHSIQEALNALGKHRTLLVIAHRLSTIKNADQIVVLDEGHIVERGTHNQLLRLDGHYATLWNMQVRSSGAVEDANLDRNNFEPINSGVEQRDGKNPEKCY